MHEQLPIFPLNTVVFPGVSMPLHVFEDRYRALVHHLLTISDKSMRLFGIVAIRDGYEIGAHGVQSVHRVGCVVQMTSVEPYEDGRFDIEVVGRQRLRLDGLDTSGQFLVGDVETLPERTAKGSDAATEAVRTYAVFEEYRRRLSAMRGGDVLDGDLPKDPEYLSYSLAATCLLTLQERQDLLEASTPLDRLVMLRHALTRAGVAFTEHVYEHDPAAPSYGLEAADALGLPAEQVLKTLLAAVDGRLVVGIVPVTGQLDLKAVASAVGGKRATMADPAQAERATGYVVGGISPIGQRRRHPTVLDESALSFPTVYVSGGRRGLDLGLSPDDLVRLTDATVAHIRR